MINLLFLTILVVCVWLLICNQRTYKHMMSIHEVVFQQDDWMAALRDFQSVSYEQHLWALVSLRNAKKLYPQSIQTLMGWMPI